MEQFRRTEMLFGKEAMEKLKNSHVAVFGVGGVGGHAVEALVRSGVGKIDIIDNDTVSVTNLNRQIFALWSTVGKSKVDAAKSRLMDINPNLEINTHNMFFLPENADSFDFSKYDYIIDAIDTVTAKIELIKRAKEANTPIISSMGTGNKLDPVKLCIADISKTSVCPLARVMRYELKKRNICKVKVLYSTEQPIRPIIPYEGDASDVRTPASTSFVPSVGGLIIASEVIKDLLKNGSY